MLQNVAGIWSAREHVEDVRDRKHTGRILGGCCQERRRWGRPGDACAHQLPKSGVMIREDYVCLKLRIALSWQSGL
eukprot:2233989-Amphidinium_carterae.1